MPPPVPTRRSSDLAQRGWGLFPRRYVCAIFDHGKNLFERMLAVSGHDGPEHADEVLAGHVATVGPFGFPQPEDDRTAVVAHPPRCRHVRSEEHTSELQTLMRISYAVFCLKQKRQKNTYFYYIMTKSLGAPEYAHNN